MFDIIFICFNFSSSPLTPGDCHWPSRPTELIRRSSSINHENLSRDAQHVFVSSARCSGEFIFYLAVDPIWSWWVSSWQPHTGASRKRNNKCVGGKFISSSLDDATNPRQEIQIFSNWNFSCRFNEFRSRQLNVLGNCLGLRIYHFSFVFCHPFRLSLLLCSELGNNDFPWDVEGNFNLQSNKDKNCILICFGFEIWINSPFSI